MPAAAAIKNKFVKKIFFAFFVSFLLCAGNASAHQPVLVYLKPENVTIENPEISRAFYDILSGKPRDYFISSQKSFDLYINLLVPEAANRDGRYSANVYSIKDGKESLIFTTDILSTGWESYYEEFGRDYYLKGPEWEKQVPAGNYKIEVSGTPGKYVLVVGKTESFDIKSILNIYWQLPALKLTFFNTSVLQFFLTPFGIAGIGFVGAILIILAIFYYLVGLIKSFIKHNQAKTLLLTSAGMVMKDEIIKLLTKPAYDITVGFITTAYKYKLEQDPGYINRDLQIMREEMGFNVQEIDIEGKTESEIMKLLELKDVIFVAGGNTFYLLCAMRKCNFEKVIKKLLKWGKVYIGVSAGSIVAGRTIKTAGWKNADKNNVGLKNLKGLDLVPFDIFVHYQPEHAEIIRAQIKNPKKRFKNLRILTDDQAILVQGKEVSLIGKGEQIIV
jgi:peptidase E